MERLNKYLAECGIASRRKCDELISDGKVSINGKTVVEMGTKVGENDVVYCDGKRVAKQTKNVYIMLHKPKGYITSASDEHGRKTVLDLVTCRERIFPIGRLDYDSEGLLLLTNDGDLANKLTHPKNHISKTYVARVSGRIKPSDLTAIRNGVAMGADVSTPAEVVILEGDDHKTRIQITIFEGKNREIRRIFETLGYEVEFLKRTAVGQLRLGNLSRGTSRYLSDSEIDYLKNI